MKVGEPVSWEVAEHRRRVTCAVERALRERAQREHALRMRRGKVLTHKISLLKLFEVASKNVAAVEVDHMDVDHARPLPANFHVNGCVPARAFAEALLLDAEARRRREHFHRLFDRTFFLKFLAVVRAAALGGFDAGGTGGGLRAALSAVQLGVGFSSNDEGDGPQSALSVLAPLAFALAAVVVLQEKSRRRAKARGAKAKKRAAKAEERLAEAEAVARECPLAAMACSPAAGPLSAVLDEVLGVSCTLRGASIQYGGTAADMDNLLARHPTRCFLFSATPMSTPSARGSPSASLPGGGLAPVPPTAIATILGSHTPRGGAGGVLELAFLNGCKSKKLGMKALLAGVDYVPAGPRWPSPRRRFLCHRFFEGVERGYRTSAFAYALAMLIAEPEPSATPAPCGAAVGGARPGAAAAAMDAPLTYLPAGIPVLLTPADRRDAARTLLAAAMWPRVALAAWARRAKQRVRNAHLVRAQLAGMLVDNLNQDLVRDIFHLAGGPRVGLP